MRISKNSNQSGFAVVESILIVVIVAILGFTGWFVWHSKQATDKSLSDASKSSQSTAPKITTKAITTFAECKVAAGSVLQETYPETCVTKAGKRFTDTTAAAPVVIQKIPYSQAPKALQDAIYDYTSKTVPGCIEDGKIVDYNRQATDQAITYQTGVAAITGVGCDGGSATLFANAQNGWQGVARTQMAFYCSDLKKYKVSVDLLDTAFAGVLNPAGCLVEGQDAESTYTGV